MYPMKLAPTFKDYLWGGERLFHEFNKDTPLRPLAESWEVSTHEEGPSIVKNGLYKNLTLSNVLASHPEYLGATSTFPVLLKFIDALLPLSLQVHPDDVYGLQVEGELGKNELWYVVDALPNAEIIVGFQNQLTKLEIQEHIQKGTLLETVRRITVKPGDCFEIPAGLVHGIGKDVLIFEVQQNSNITYRVYDYQRKDAFGNLRELHIKKALEVIAPSLFSRNLGNAPFVKHPGHRIKTLTRWEWFSASLIEIDGASLFHSPENSYETLSCISGSLSLVHNNTAYSIIQGDSYFLPANLGAYFISGTGSLITTCL